MKVRNILISQPEPTDGRSPYNDLKDKFKVNLQYRPFIQVEPVTAKEFRREKVSILEHTAVILTSRTLIEHFFRLAAELRTEIPPEMKYFCTSESVALYLQKFITYRKRKVFYPKVKEQEVLDVLLKHKVERYLVPRSNQQNNELVGFMTKHKLKFSEATLYHSIPCDISDMTNVGTFDIITFFSPMGIKTLLDSFPNFEQKETRIAAFGPATCSAVTDAGLRLDIEAPTPLLPSMKMALEEYIKKANK